MSEDRARDYAEWYVWAKRNLSSTPEICHAAANAAADAKRAGGDPQAAARTAAQSRSGPGWSEPETPEIRQYAEWYDWARLELGASGDNLGVATSAAVASLRGGGDARGAASAARAAIGKSDPPTTSSPPPLPAQTGSPPTQSPGMLPPPPPPPPPPPSGYPPVATPTWSPGAYPAYPAYPGGQATGYGYPGSAGTDGYAIASLVCSIVALPAIFCYGIPAIALGLVGFFLGRSSLKRIAASGGFKAGHGIATAGWVIGIVAAVLGLLYAIVSIGLVALLVSGVIPTPSPSP